MLYPVRVPRESHRVGPIVGAKDGSTEGISEGTLPSTMMPSANMTRKNSVFRMGEGEVGSRPPPPHLEAMGQAKRTVV
jgi:hypothetical protein